MLRGINQQQIFEEDEDYRKFLDVVKDCKEISEFELYAYCLMGNHIHMLIKEKKEPIEQIVKRIGSRFVYWYNVKYSRKGHLFQDRYKSEPVEEQVYFDTVLVYIHRNPIKAGICKKPGDYEFSSYNEYVGNAIIADTGYVFGYWNPEQFVRYNEEDLTIECLDITEGETVRVTDEEAKDIIKRVSRCENVSEFQALEIKKRDKYLKKLRERGLSIRQISRLTGVSFNIVRKF
ncbi:MAG: transposase [Clostridia bacterium]|nr:transposase [Clostridia bacterium]